MTTPNADNARNVTKYTGQNYTFTPSYVRSRDPSQNDIRDPKNQGYYPFTALWINKTNQRLWALVNIANNKATWVLLSASASEPLLTLSDTTNTVVQPSSTGSTPPSNIQLVGGTGISVVSNPGSNSITFTAVGVGGAITGIHPDAHTAPGTDPVVPDGSGNVRIEGGVTFATGTQANPIRTNSLLANTMDLQIQLAGANPTSSTPNNFGVVQFDGNEFTVTSGFVQLKNTPFSGTVTTVGAVTGNININIPIPNNSTTSIRSTIAGFTDNNLGISGELIGGMTNISGVLSLVGDEVDLVRVNPASLAAWNANLVISGTNAVVQVLGVAGRTINWRAFIDIVSAP